MKRKMNIILKKISQTTKKKKVHKKTTGKPNKDKDDTTVEPENMDVTDEDDMSLLDHQFSVTIHETTGPLVTSSCTRLEEQILGTSSTK